MSELDDPCVIAKLLQKYYPLVLTLDVYLDRIIALPHPLVQPNDSLEYELFVRYSLVACEDEVQGTSLSFQYAVPHVTQTEVVDKAQSTIMRQNASNKRPDMLTLGYKAAGPDLGHASTRTDRPHFVSVFPNTILTFLQGPLFRTLLQRIGSEAMNHLLVATSIFFALPNSCFCQLTGFPSSAKVTTMTSRLVDLSNHLAKPENPLKRKDGDLQRTPRKKVKIQNQENLHDFPSTSEIGFFRARLFYTRIERSPVDKSIHYGLPVQHVLNRMPLHPVPRNADEVSRHLLKFIFPKEFGLKCVFTEPRRPKSDPLCMDDDTKEKEIKRVGPIKTPKRLKGLLPLVHQLLRRHKKCKYKVLLSLTCRRKDVVAVNDDRAILEMLTESTQLPFDPSMSANSHEPKQSGKAKPAKPRFAEFVTTHFEVYRFIATVTKRVIPYDLWGSKRNLRLILKRVKEFIFCLRYETLTLHYVLQDFRISDCDWLLASNPAALNQRPSVSDALKRRELLEQFLYWYFDDFVIPLLQTTFYITEAAGYRNRVLYFRHNVWHALCRPFVQQLRTVTLQQLPKDEADALLRKGKLGFSYVRHLPKETGVRPIVNLSRKVIRNPTTGFTQSINQILQAAFHILNYEKEQNLDRLQASVFGPQEIYKRLKDFKTAVMHADKTLPKLYFVKVDVRACFDSIHQSKLLEIVQQLFSEEQYMVRKHGEVAPVAGLVRRTYPRRAHPAFEHTSFVHYATKLANSLRNTIFIDQVTFTIEDREEILDLLREHICDNIIKIGSAYYRQIIGIPQGSILSTILCSFFYGDLEKHKLNFSNDPACAFFRLIDDYLLITPDKFKAEKFLSMMEEGHPEYGCFIAKEKTKTNLDSAGIDYANRIPEEQAKFAWCGRLIDMKDLSVSSDYSVYSGKHVGDSITTYRTNKPGANFLRMMILLAKRNCHQIYTDSTLNSAYNVHLNIYQNFLITAMKMYSYLRHLGRSFRRNATFLIAAIDKIITSTWSGLRRRLDMEEEDERSRRKAITWLGLHAFLVILKPRRNVYEQCVKSLQIKVRAADCDNYHTRFREVVRDGMAGFRGAKY